MADHRRNLQVSAASIFMAVLATGLGGCVSTDEHVFHSTSTLPVTVTLYSPTLAETVWEMEVPVRHKLLIDLDRVDEVELYSISGQPANVLKWWLYEEDRDKNDPVDHEIQELAGSDLLLQVTYRPAPEDPVGTSQDGIADEPGGLGDEGDASGESGDDKAGSGEGGAGSGDDDGDGGDGGVIPGAEPPATLPAPRRSI